MHRALGVSPVTHMCVLHDSSVVLVGKSEGPWKLQKFSWTLDAQLSDVTLNAEVVGMTSVVMNEKPAVVIAYRLV